MYDKLILPLYTAILFCSGPSLIAVSRQADDCTSGFMSIDRIEAAIQGEYEGEEHVIGKVLALNPSINRQAILPYINFTCGGSILSWTFGAQWEGNSPRYTELQIWRSSWDGSYTKVGSTTVMLEEENSTWLYQYTLTSPLPFQAGDILGYFQGSQSTSQLRLLFEDVGSDHPLYQNIQESPSSQFIFGSNIITFDRYRFLISVETSSAGCGCGFMSRERMHILLGLETVGDRIFIDQRQQIIPDIKFTCDGLITKWIFGAKWRKERDFYPELQLWRKNDDIYYKINSTVINVSSQSPTHINEYDNFLPIPVLAGDIIGMFIPQRMKSTFLLWFEKDNGPVAYYVDTGSATESPVDAIDLQHMQSLTSTSYFPLVTVEIWPKVYPTSSWLDLTPTSIPCQSAVTNPMSSTGGGGDNMPVFAAVGVAGTLLVLITAAAIIITVLVCLRKSKGMNVRDNVVYQSSTSEVKLSPNAAYTATDDRSSNSHDQEYMYITTTTTPSQSVNTTTSIKTTSITDEAYNIPTPTNVAYTIPTSANSAYEAIVPTSTNPTQSQSGCNTPTHDYI